jgi:hypothetical protein
MGLTPQRFVWLVGLSMLLVGLTSCRGQHAVESGDYTIYVHGSSLLPRGGLDAQIEGLLALHDGCVVLESEESQGWYPVVWPTRTSIASADPFAIKLPSGEELAFGERVTGSGGYLHPEDVEVDIPQECFGAWSEIAVFNPDDNPSEG